MAAWRVAQWALAVAVIVALVIAADAGTSSRPRLKPLAGVHDGELVMDTGNALELECEGTGPLSWSAPCIVNEFKDQCDITTSGNSSKLSIKQAYFNDTGYYKCYTEGLSEEFDAVYVYVRDPLKPFVIDKQMTHVTAAQYKEAILDCRTTDPEIKVELYDIGHQRIPLGEHPSDGLVVSWEPHQGFVLAHVDLKHSDLYMCNVSGDGRAEAEAGAPAASLLMNLVVMPMTTSVPRPTIEAREATPHALLGQNVTLTCNVEMYHGVTFIIMWERPENASAVFLLGVSLAQPLALDTSRTLGTRPLTLFDVKPEDAGNYTCRVTDYSGLSSETTFELIVGGNESYVKFFTDTDTVTVPRGETATWAVQVDAYPAADFFWFNPNNKSISNGMNAKYRTINSSKEAVLQVLDVQPEDRGTYLLQVNTGKIVSYQNLKLFVHVPPIAVIYSPPDPFAVNESLIINCYVNSSSPPHIEWMWKPCGQSLHNCSSRANFSQLSESTYATSVVNDMRTESTLTFVPKESGYLSCLAGNADGMDNDTQSIQVTDLPHASVRGAWGPQSAVVGDSVTLRCGALKENYTTYTLEWFRLENAKRHRITMWNAKEYDEPTSLSLQRMLRLAPVGLMDGGMYECVARETDAEEWNMTLTLKVHDPLKPFFKETNMDTDKKTLKRDTFLDLKCLFGGIPSPEISWYKDDMLLVPGPDLPKLNLRNDNTTLIVNYMADSDAGVYECVASNRVGRISKSMQIDIEGSSSLNISMIAVILVAAILMIIILPLSVSYYKGMNLRRELAIVGLQNFQDGSPDALNPDRPADEQTELLPYDRKWEFPRDKLKLGKTLGSGAFGVVLKAEARGIVEGEDWTTVAVKMVKRTSDLAYIKALASELKIMVHLGRHLNVVNLLGACTDNLAKRELLVIVEYCRFGNLQNYLLRHRAAFIDQLDPRTGAINASIGSDVLKRLSDSADGGRSDCETTGGAAGGAAGGPDYRAGCGHDSSGAEHICMSPTGGEDAYITNSTGSNQPEWRSNYQSDYRGNVRPMCSRDLLCWAFQVSRGMQYLAERKVLHGDLAARNILLADENIVKICDFGLAKSMYKSDNYKKKGDGPLPVKWMALESIRDRVFSTQSDVWSFGVVLWELFSLGATPYPGMAADEKLYNKLLDGYRMERPPYATVDIYNTMLHCWAANPNRRPSFDDLVDSLGGFLEESVRQHYLELDNQYIHMNEQWRQDGHTDYLGMLSAPNYRNLVSPRDEEDSGYVNSPVSPARSPVSVTSDSGYMLMKGPSVTNADPGTPLSADIFSPRPGAQVFTFASPPVSSVATPNYPTGLSPSPSPSPQPPAETSPSFANPCYAPLPVVSSSDNYVNMLQNKMTPNSSTKGGHSVVSFANPSYVSRPLAVDESQTETYT